MPRGQPVSDWQKGTPQSMQRAPCVLSSSSCARQKNEGEKIGRDQLTSCIEHDPQGAGEDPLITQLSELAGIQHLKDKIRPGREKLPIKGHISARAKHAP